MHALVGKTPSDTRGSVPEGRSMLRNWCAVKLFMMGSIGPCPLCL